MLEHGCICMKISKLMARLTWYLCMRVVQDPISAISWELRSTNSLQLWGSGTAVVLETLLAAEWMAPCEGGLNTVSISPRSAEGTIQKDKVTGWRKKKKDPWGLVLKLKFNSLFYKSHLFWKSCEPFGAQLILCTHISQKQWKRMLDSWSGFLLYTNWTQSGDDWREERFYFNNWNP